MFDPILQERAQQYIFRGRSDDGVDPPFLIGISRWCDTGEITLHQKYRGAEWGQKVTLSPADWGRIIELMKPHLEQPDRLRPPEP